jgi:hypothetical protein
VYFTVTSAPGQNCTNIEEWFDYEPQCKHGSELEEMGYGEVACYRIGAFYYGVLYKGGPYATEQDCNEECEESGN